MFFVFLPELLRAFCSAASAPVSFAVGRSPQNQKADGLFLTREPCFSKRLYAYKLTVGQYAKNAWHTLEELVQKANIFQQTKERKIHVKQILFTQVGKAALVEAPVRALGANDVRVRTAVSSISCGTERANLTGSSNTSKNGGKPHYPVALGYSSAGTVEELGSAVTTVKPGDRVAMYWSVHATYNVLPETNLIKLPDNVSFASGALMHIAAFPLAAIRKTRLELGESMLVMGLGILGQFAVTLAHVAGAAPVIAADPNPVRRADALAHGADYALDPLEPDFAERVKELTGGGAKTAVEVTGVGAGLNEVLDAMAPFGRVALLGCTRDPNFTVDYYQKVHKPGITLIGAHTMARPGVDSRPGFFTVRDDMTALVKLASLGRIDFEGRVLETHTPEEAPEVYDRLINDPNFPIFVQFLWQ